MQANNSLERAGDAAVSPSDNADRESEKARDGAIPGRSARSR